jgi:hypothetical protein
MVVHLQTIPVPTVLTALARNDPEPVLVVHALQRGSGRTRLHSVQRLVVVPCSCSGSTVIAYHKFYMVRRKRVCHYAP